MAAPMTSTAPTAADYTPHALTQDEKIRIMAATDCRMLCAALGSMPTAHADLLRNWCWEIQLTGLNLHVATVACLKTWLKAIMLTDTDETCMLRLLIQLQSSGLLHEQLLWMQQAVPEAAPSIPAVPEVAASPVPPVSTPKIIKRRARKRSFRKGYNIDM
jgi:hypothetical protein